MTITEEIVQKRIEELKLEEKQIRESHATLVRDFQERSTLVQQMANNNATRLAQIRGAIDQLTQLLNGKDKP